METKERNNVVMGMLLAAICIMAVGYAALAQELTISGTATITSTWDVAITSVTVDSTKTSTATNGDTMGVYDDADTIQTQGTTAKFDVTLTNPGDEITYKIVVSNAGSLKAKLDGITTIYKNASNSEVTATGTDNDDAILYSVTGDVDAGHKLAAKSGDVAGTNTIYVTVKYNPDVETQPTADQLTKTVSINLNYVQDRS